MTRATRREYLGDHVYRDVPTVAMDAAPDDKSIDEEQDKRDHDLALNEALDCYDRTGDRAEALDAYAGARDRRRSLRAATDRARDGELDGEGRSREEAYRISRDAEVDHRRDLDPLVKRGADSRRGMAHDRASARAVANLSLDQIFGGASRQ